jgi:hypothetical protein
MQMAQSKWQMVFWVALFCASCFLPHAAFAATNISSSASQHWAWNDIIGWIDFYTPNNITVSSTNLSGYASSSMGPLSLDCNTSPSGTICGTSNYQVGNDGSGNLSGWAWNDAIGWISFFWGDATANPTATSTYTSTCTSYGLYCGVYIDASGNFHGYAWNDAVGWISFNCLDPSICGTSNYEVATTWAAVGTTGYLDSTAFDTGVASGTELNSVLWQGSLNGLANGSVGFQFAGSNSSSGPWVFTGPDGTASTSYIGLPGVPIPITNYATYNAYRYLRYRIILVSGVGQVASPQVTDVSIDWSP